MVKVTGNSTRALTSDKAWPDGNTLTVATVNQSGQGGKLVHAKAMASSPSLIFAMSEHVVREV